MKLVMTLLVRDEADIICANIEFHLAHGVDALVIVDNGSQDGTRDVIDDYVRTGVAVVFDEPGRDFAQSTWVTRAALYARDEMGADWIINNDADEFWTAPGGSLRQIASDAKEPLLICPRLNLICAHEDVGSNKMLSMPAYRFSRPIAVPVLVDIYNDNLPAPYFYLELPPKVMTRAQGLREIAQGNHFAKYEGAAVSEHAEIEIFHFPIRSRAQFERKIVQGGQAYLVNRNLSERTGWHWRRWYRMHQHGGVEPALVDALPSKARLQRDLSEGNVLLDDRIHTLTGKTSFG